MATSAEATGSVQRNPQGRALGEPGQPVRLTGSDGGANRLRAARAACEP